MLTLVDIAKKLNKPASTIRYYAKNYSEFLPTQKKEGVRWALYEPTAFDIFKVIVELTQKQLHRDDIKKQLKKQFGVVIDAEAEDLQQQKGNLAQRANNYITATTLQQALWLSKETAELNQRFASSINNQKELLNYKEDEIKKLKGELEAERAKTTELKNQNTELQNTITTIKKRRIKRISKPTRHKKKSKGVFGWLTS
jgi:type III secretory pathway component EscV